MDRGLTRQSGWDDGHGCEGWHFPDQPMRRARAWLSLKAGRARYGQANDHPGERSALASMQLRHHTSVWSAAPKGRWQIRPVGGTIRTDARSWIPDAREEASLRATRAILGNPGRVHRVCGAPTNSYLGLIRSGISAMLEREAQVSQHMASQCRLR
jgi:hypothetical protein